jgi:tRNA(Ile)-lysidine synthase
MMSRVADLLHEVRQFVRRQRLLQNGASVMVGVSGGPDSVTLLHILLALAPEFRLDLHVAHLNHGLRGPEADADAAFVSHLAHAWGVPCICGSTDVRTLAKRASLSLEEAARAARYEFLAGVAAAAGADVVAVGHNADDQAETVLMHLLRGSGAAGLRGMLPRTDLPQSAQRAYGIGQPGSGAAGTPGEAGSRWSRGGLGPRPILIRPLLAIPRSAIMDYCAQHNLETRSDSSNADRSLYRNRLRHELLPLLEQYNPSIKEMLNHSAAAMAADYEVLTGVVAEGWKNTVRQAPGIGPEDAVSEISFDLASWRALPIALQRATVRLAIGRIRDSLRDISWQHVERAVWLAREGHDGQAATLVAGLLLKIEHDQLRIGPEGREHADDRATRHAQRGQGAGVRPAPHALEGSRWPQITGRLSLNPGVTPLDSSWQVQVRRVAQVDLPSSFPMQEDPSLAWLDADATGPALVLRPREPGDRFQPLGLGGHSVTLHKFMIDVHVPSRARTGWPLLVGQDGIAWICGLRLDARAAARAGAGDVWEVRLQRQAGQ